MAIRTRLAGKPASDSTTMNITEQKINQLADMFKALAHPLRVELITIIIDEQLVSIPDLQHQLPDIDPFRLYSNLRYMHERQVVKKLQKGREVYYGLSENAISAGLDTFFQARNRKPVFGA